MFINCHLSYLKYKIIKNWVMYAIEQTITGRYVICFLKLFFKPGSAPQLKVWPNRILRKTAEYFSLHISCFF